MTVNAQLKSCEQHNLTKQPGLHGNLSLLSLFYHAAIAGVLRMPKYVMPAWQVMLVWRKPWKVCSAHTATYFLSKKISAVLTLMSNSWKQQVCATKSFTDLRYSMLNPLTAPSATEWVCLFLPPAVEICEQRCWPPDRSVSSYLHGDFVILLGPAFSIIIHATHGKDRCWLHTKVVREVFFWACQP